MLANILWICGVYLPFCMSYFVMGIALPGPFIEFFFAIRSRYAHKFPKFHIMCFVFTEIKSILECSELSKVCTYVRTKAQNTQKVMQVIFVPLFVFFSKLGCESVFVLVGQLFFYDVRTYIYIPLTYKSEHSKTNKHGMPYYATFQITIIIYLCLFCRLMKHGFKFLFYLCSICCALNIAVEIVIFIRGCFIHYFNWFSALLFIIAVV